MAITEVFPNPTVAKVIFQIRFTNLFAIENLIGEYQAAIMDRYEESNLLIRRNFLIANLAPGQAIEGPAEDNEAVPVGKVWNFKSSQGVELNVQTDSLDISSSSHKTYNNSDAPSRFRDAIRHAVDSFLKITKLPVIQRIGLRYIDDCPVPGMTNADFMRFYETAFPLSRFPLPDVEELFFRVRVKKDPYVVQYVEHLHQDGLRWRYALDMDAFAVKVNAAEYLSVTDRLHELIVAEYEASIKEPVYAHMRKPKTAEDPS